VLIVGVFSLFMIPATSGSSGLRATPGSSGLRATPGSSGLRCDGPTNLVQVTVKEALKSPPTYLFVVKNLHKSPIAIFGIGQGDREEMQSIPDNIPNTFTSPNGWESGTAFKDESMFMQIFWKTQDSAAMVGPGQTLDGFKVEMPQQSQKKEPLFHLDGTPSTPLDMKKAPFRIYLKDGTCAWGRVKEEKVEGKRP
jgi:hypothetical protein